MCYRPTDFSFGFFSLFSGPAALLKRPGYSTLDESNRRNPRFGYPRIARIISKTFGIKIDGNVVRRVLAKYYRPEFDGNGPSWLTFLGHMKDSLWSVDLFRCESITLKSHWVLVVMDHFTRRIIGFAVHDGDVNGMTLCHRYHLPPPVAPPVVPTPHPPR